MNYLTIVYTEFLYRPLLNGLVWFYNVLPYQDLGLAIVIFVLVIRLILTPLLLKGQHAQKKMALLQPEIKKVQEQHKNDKEAQGRALMELYAKYQINPFSGCLPLLVQIPVLLALLSIFQGILNPENLSYLYSFIQNPGTINPLVFGLFDLSAKGNWVLGVLAGASQYLQTKLTLPASSNGAGQGDFAKSLQWQSLYVFPFFIVVWAFFFPAAAILYWTVWNIFGIVQEILVKKLSNDTGNNQK